MAKAPPAPPRQLRRVGAPAPPPKKPVASSSKTPVRRTRSGDRLENGQVRAIDMAIPGSSSVKQTKPIANKNDAPSSDNEDEMEMEEIPTAPVKSRETTTSDGEIQIKAEPMDEDSTMDQGQEESGMERGTTEETVPEDYGFAEEDAAAEAMKGKEKALEVPSEPVIITIGEEISEEARKKAIALANRRKPLTARDRALRLEAHKLHILTLLANAMVRNRWASEQLLKARLLSLAPHEYHKAFNIRPSVYPDASRRSRLFLAALQDLATWWANEFFTVPEEDNAVGIRSKTWDEVMEIVENLPKVSRPNKEEAPGKPSSSKKKGKGKAKEDAADEYDEFVQKLGTGGERIRTVKSLQKKALQGFGGRDTSAQLFVSLCRAMGLGARLVVSLQPVGWKAEKTAAPKKKLTAQLRTVAQAASESHTQTEEDEMEEIKIGTAAKHPVEGLEGKPKWSDTGAKGFPQTNGQTLGGVNVVRRPIDQYKLRPLKPQKLGSASATASKKKAKVIDLSTQPPVFWAEVYSRPDQKWIPVDPVRGTIKRRKDFEPVNDNGPIRMLYVVGFEEDGYAREITVRYAKNFGAKTIKLRVPVKQGQEDWWERVMASLQRPYRLNRDDLEDAELATSQISEGMPMMMAGFKDHPLYVLERHLLQDQVIVPKREVGRFKGEAVYRRQNVFSCKTPDNWMRVGRRIKAKEEALKWVKQKGVTLEKRRQQERAIQEGLEPLQQGLYAEWQTELYIPPPIKDGKIPVNAFGNMDLWVDTMLPKGAVHLPLKGIAKVAKQMGINYAEACTGFEFKKQRAIPVITGIVVAKGQEDKLLDAYWKSTAAAEERARAKLEDKALKRWQKLIQGIQIRARLQQQYGHAAAGAPVLSVPAPRKIKPVKANASISVNDKPSQGLDVSSPAPPDSADTGGGFLVEDEEDVEGGGEDLQNGQDAEAVEEDRDDDVIYQGWAQNDAEEDAQPGDNQVVVIDSTDDGQEAETRQKTIEVEDDDEDNDDDIQIVEPSKWTTKPSTQPRTIRLTRSGGSGVGPSTASQPAQAQSTSRPQRQTGRASRAKAAAPPAAATPTTRSLRTSTRTTRKSYAEENDDVMMDDD